MSARQFLIAIFVAAFIVRLAAVVSLRDTSRGPSASMGADGLEFDQLARQTASGHGYSYQTTGPTSFRAPGFPLFLAGIYKLAGGAHYRLVYLIFCLLGAASCLVIYALAREILPERTARTAATLGALYAPHVYFATEFASENLFVPILGLGLWLLIRCWTNGSLKRAAAAGALLGVATLVRPFAILLLPALVVVLAISSVRASARRWRSAAVFAACFLGAIVPWTARNYALHGRFVLIATNGGSTFYGANNARVATELHHLGSWISTAELPHRDLIDAAPGEVAHDKVEWRLGLQWLRENPAKIPLLAAYKLARLWLPELASANRKFVLLMACAYLPFLLLFGVAALQFWRDPSYRSTPWLFIRIALACTVTTALVFWGSPRFRDANTVILMIYAAVGAQSLWALRSRPTTASTGQLPDRREATTA